eukprot:6209597-Pleurochrysis_carterae.AAC.1
MARQHFWRPATSIKEIQLPRLAAPNADAHDGLTSGAGLLNKKMSERHAAQALEVRRDGIENGHRGLGFFLHAAGLRNLLRFCKWSEMR